MEHMLAEGAMQRKKQQSLDSYKPRGGGGGHGGWCVLQGRERMGSTRAETAHWICD